eukprot:gnl/TRDRNA2_/TRDRNA2_87908_c0_seq1.p1 gnl/TRDRNA2_/TRDRNA2_87908_c0~~gnl/TRDRNA2_/TRDRNA2_87908_c0_seq1.p1  ORF type:complete len:373 (+),score=54.72 gnl/TRDRNA2_/TRDRNA2_87908_c0_seq1:86-1120(+)
MGGAPRSGRGIGGEREKPRNVQISTAMSMVLRHNAAELLASGVRPDGFCRVDEVLGVEALQDLECSREELESVVRSCPKRRFELGYDEEVGDLIRATQGHSIASVEDAYLLRPLSVSECDLLPEACVHGTYRQHLEDILRFGLVAGGASGQGTRRHVHFACFEPGSTRQGSGPVSGMRSNCEVAIHLDLPRALADGVPFFASKNGVIVSPGVDGVVSAAYILKVKDLQAQQWLDLPTVDPGPANPAEFARWRREKLRSAVLEQVDFYFGDENYPGDSWMRSQADADGWTSLSAVMQCSRMKKLIESNDLGFLSECLAISEVVEVSSDGGSLRRRHPFEVSSSVA